MKRIVAYIMLLALALTLAACGTAAAPTDSASRPDTTQVPATVGESGDASPLVYRAMWLSYLDWTSLDTSGESAFAASAATMMQNIASIGCNCVIIQVRPFGDAIYPSSVYGWSYLCTGTAGQDPGYDPLAVLIDAAHAQKLAVEAWINPYRIRTNANLPAGEYGADNPALTHPEWTVTVDDGLYYDPSLPEVRQMVLDGVQEVLQNYAVEGIHFDDYFYPTTDESFDAERYAASGTSLSLADWRRENVNTLVKDTYVLIKNSGKNVVFGISPQGNNDNNYNGQYSDVGLWLREAGYVDYVMPQIYWGFGFTLKNGSTSYAFENVTQSWAAMPRADGVALCFGLGAYRIGDGDGGTQDQAQWSSGHNLADQVNALRALPGVRGYALFRYNFLFANGTYAQLAQSEASALAAA